MAHNEKQIRSDRERAKRARHRLHAGFSGRHDKTQAKLEAKARRE